MTGDELRTARMAADLTQQELGDKLDVSMRTVGNWERSTGRLPRARERQIRDVLGAVGESGDPFDGISDMALLVELGKRLDRVARERGESDDVPAQQKIVNGRDEDSQTVMPPPVEPPPPRVRGQRPARPGQDTDPNL